MTLATTRSLLHATAWHLLALAILLAPGVGTALAADARASRYYEDALARLEKKDVPGALIQLRNALQIDRKMLPAHVLLGKTLLDNGEVAAAEVEFNESLALGVNRAEVVVPLARSVAAQSRLKDVVNDKRFAPDGLPPRVLSPLLLIQAAAQSDLGNGAQAMKLIGDARALDPKSPESWQAEVPVRLRARQYSAAVAAADQALALTPDSADAHYLRGSISHAQGAAAPALAEYDRAIRLKPDHGESLIARAGLYMDMKRLDAAAADIAAVRKLAPREPRAAYLGSLIAEQRGDAKAARAALVDITAALDPVPIEFLHFRHQLLMLGGLAHHALRENEKARPYLEALSQQQADNPVAKLLAQIHLGDRAYDAAILALEPYIKTHPNDTQAVVLLASAQMGKGRSAQAAQLLRDALKNDDSPRLHSFLGVTLMGGGKTADALNELERGYRKDPSQVAAGAALADLYLRYNKPAKAVEITRSLVAREPNAPQYRQMLGVALAQGGDIAGARAAYEQSLKLDPRFVPTLLNLARLDARAGSLDTATQRLAAVLAVNPRHVDAVIELAFIAGRRGQAAETVRYLEKAADYSGPGDNRALLLLADHHLRSAAPDAAADVIKKLVVKAPDSFAVVLATARVRLATGDLQAAQQALTRASRLAEFDTAKQVQVAALQLTAGDAKGALYSLGKALQGQADHLPAKVLMVEANLRLGELGPAEATAREVATRQPGLPIGNALLGDVAMARGQPAAALDAYRKAQQIEASSAGLLRIYGALARQKQDEAAAQAAETWLKARPRDIEVRRALADGHARAGKPQQAKAAYEALLAIKADDADALNNLANVLLQIKDPAALKVAERALALRPKAAHILGTTGWAAFQAGQGERGLNLVRDARLRDPNNRSTRYFLAVMLASAGRGDEARSELQSALKSGGPFAYTREAEDLLKTLK